MALKAQVVIITHHNFTIQDYVNAINEKYKTYENVVFNSFTPSSKDITLIMGRSMLTLSYINKSNYTKQRLIHMLFSGKLISVYSENHVEEYPIFTEQYNPKQVVDLCDYDVYPNL